MGARRPLEQLRPGDVVTLQVVGPDAGAAEIAVAGPSAVSFRIGGSPAASDAGATVTADAPGVARVVIAIHGRVVLQFRIACRAPASDAAARCAHALAQHRARLAELDGFVSSLVDQLVQATCELDGHLRARAVISPQLSDARELAMLLSDPPPDDARAALTLLRAVWSRVARFGVATRAIAILAPDELAALAPSTAVPATVAELFARIRAAIAREAEWVTALLEAWPAKLAMRTARAPDLELSAGVGACSADVSALPRMFWQTWFQEHALLIRPDKTGPRASWRMGRGVLGLLGAGQAATWQAAVASDVDAVAAAVSALGVL
ncbi:MAG TPA: hypothetical protein VFP84_30820 [Kofleriaceae bacterium]|nr:hypothetical protein [Kofleriaceae bacterium]